MSRSSPRASRGRSLRARLRTLRVRHIGQAPFGRALSDKTRPVCAPCLGSARPFGRSGPDNRGGISAAASVSMRTVGQLRWGSVRARPCSFDPCGAGSARPSVADPRRKAPVLLSRPNRSATGPFGFAFSYNSPKLSPSATIWSLKTPKPVDLAAFGLRPHNNLTRTRPLSMRVTTALHPCRLALSVSPF